MKRTFILFSLALVCFLLGAIDYIAQPQMSPITIERIVSKDEPVRIEWETFSLSADSGVLMHDLTIRLSVLRREEAQQMPSGMANVTGLLTESFCLLPNGVHFAEPAIITVPYDIHRLPTGYNAEDIFTFYYDEELATWKQLERMGIDTVLHTVSSYTTHFTEFANAVIKVPEMPEAKAFVPTAMTDLPDVNPLQGIPMIAAPQANNRGTAELTYPIELPQGRRGLQPNIDLHYSSAGGNGILGIGWDINVPAITIDTRWGVPRYDAFLETEAYLLNGEQLLLMTDETSVHPLLHHSGEDGFAVRKYGSIEYRARDSRNQDRIVRYGNTLDSIWWCVTDRSGTKYFYGYDPIYNRLDESALIRTAENKIGQWPLSCVVDINGNYIRYKYHTYDNHAYINSIDYTGNLAIGTHPVYSIQFFYGNRDDIVVSGRLGLLQKQKQRLNCIFVIFNDSPIYQYHFEYEIGEHTQNKSRLISIGKFDAPQVTKCEDYFSNRRTTGENWDTLDGYLLKNNLKSVSDLLGTITSDSLPGCITRFNYENAVALSDIFSKSEQKTISQSQPLGKNSNRSWSIGGTATIGFDFNTALTDLSLGGNYTYSRSTGSVLTSLMDIDGDGLPDMVFEEDGHVKYYHQYSDSTFETVAYTIPGISSMARDVSSSHNFGLQADFDLSQIKADISYTPTIEHSYTDIYFTDINADGLPDLVYKDTIYVNYLQNGRPTFSPMAESNHAQVNNSTCGVIHRTGSVDTRLECNTEWVLQEVISRNKITRMEQQTLNQDSKFQGLDYDQHKPIHGAAPENEHSSSIKDFLYPTQLDLSPHVAATQLHLTDTCAYTFSLIGDPNWKDSINKVVAIGDSLYVYRLETKCTDSSELPNVDIVRVWVAPEDGSIILNSNIRLLPDTSLSRQLSRKVDGIKYTIQYDTTIIGSGSIGEDDYSLHTSFSSFAVQANKVLLFRLSAVDDRRFDDVEWEQTIQYTTGARYNSADDYVCSGNNHFKAPAAGDMLVGYNLVNEQSAPYTISVLRNDTAELTADRLNVYSQVEEGEEISFSLGYPTAVEPQWSKLHIHPYVYFVPTDSTITDTLRYYPDVQVSCTSTLPNDTARYRRLFGLLHKGWGQFAYNNASNDSIICIDSLYNAEVAAVSELSRSNSNSEHNRWKNRLRADSTSFVLSSDNDSVSMDILNSYIDSIRMYDPLSNGSKWIGMHANSRTNNWEAYGNLGFLGQRIQSTSQQISGVEPDTEVEDIEYDSAIPVGNGNSPVTTIRKKTSSVQHAISAGIGLGPANFNRNISFGSHSIDMDAIDMNGDGFPDFVGTSSIQYTMPWGGLDSRVTPIDVHHPQSKVHSNGGGVSGGKNIAAFSIENGLRRKYAYNASLSGGGSGSVTWNRNNITYMDMNADGLPDVVDVKEGKVWYNLGYSFSAGEDIPVGLSIYEGESRSISGNFSGAYTLVSGNILQLINKDIRSIHQYSFSAGVTGSFTQNNVLSQLTDIDGDGYPDQITANEFGLYGQIVANGNSSPRACIFNHPLVGYSVNVGTTLGITAGFTWLSAAKLTFGVQSSPWASSWSCTNSTLLDFNGDGFTDLIDRNGRDSITVYFNRNGSRPVNLLTSVTNPTGQQIHIKYEQTTPSVQQRGRSWRMKSVDDEISAHDDTQLLTKSVNYDGPYFDNFEKVDYGYESVETTENNEKVFLEEFFNRNFASRGEKRADLLMNTAGNKYIGHRHELGYFNRNGARLDAESMCNDTTVVSRDETFWTDYYQDSILKISTKYTLQYDQWHNLTRRTEYGDTAVAGDEWIQEITYCDPQNQRWHHNLISLPSQETVRDFSGHLLRQSLCFYDSKGQPITMVMRDSMLNMDAATYIDYDGWGNVSEITFPENSQSNTAECPWQEFYYDNVTATYPLKIINQFGEAQYTLYDYRLGLPTLTVDPAGYGIAYDYDLSGRLKSVTAPREHFSTDSLPTISYYYCLPYHDLGDTLAACSNPYIIQVAASEGVVSIASTLYDQRGQVLQKRNLRNLSGSPQWVTDGLAIKDAFYRTRESFFPFSTNFGLDELDRFPSSPYYVSTDYDVMDRVTSVVNPDNTRKRYRYSFGNDAHSNLRLQVIATDENGYDTKVLSAPQEWQIQTEAADHSLTQYSYNPIGELIQVDDADGYQTSYRYDMFGRCVERNHPDAGITQWIYAPLGNLLYLQTAVLRETSSSIKYTYDYNRLKTIVYTLHPENNVSYVYDYAGRVSHREDGAGSEDFTYDELGNVATSVRHIIVPTESVEYVFKMQYKYDSFGRMMTITYPDNEEVYYQYDLGGLLKAVYGEKDSNRKEYLYDRQYDEFDRKVVDMFGNGVKSLYGYDSRRQWMSSLYTGIPSSAPFQNITYTHDPVGNITTISQYAPALSTTMGGMYKNVYQYDSLYRLVSSSGNQDFPYTFSASFSPSGKLGTKSTVYSGVHSDLYYGYDSLHSTHQVRSIFDPYNGSTEYFWDANGNLSQIKSCDRGVRFHEWDEENRLRLVCGERTAGYYGYDANGQRVYKLIGTSAISRKNAGYTAVEARLDDLTLYPNPYLVISGKGYTKHYYAGAERLATTIGTGGFADVIAPIDSAISSSDSARLESMRRYYRFKRYPFGQVTDDLGAHSIVDIQWNDSAVLQHRCSPDNPEVLDLPLKPVNLLLSVIRSFFEQDEKEDEVYYYHGDHLGSASWITDKTGTPIQYIHYAPYGELIANQQATGYDERFKFTGKERDAESGYDYFGARFLWSDAGFWLSVDPLADKYPGLTPYLYCNGNPIMLIDPDGRSAVVGDDGEVLGVIENDDHFIYYAAKDWTAQQGTDNLEKVGLMIGNNDFYQKLKSEKLPCFGLFYTKASLSAHMSVGIQGGMKMDGGLFKGLTLTGNLVSVELLSAGYSLADGADLNYVGKNDMYNISQELSLGLIFGAGIGQNFTTKGYGYESQETWAKFLGTYKHDGITQQQTWSFDINLSVSAIIGASLNMCIPFTYKR